jgi:hypothetical protein
MLLCFHTGRRRKPNDHPENTDDHVTQSIAFGYGLSSYSREAHLGITDSRDIHFF